MATHHGKEGVLKSGSNTVAEVVDFEIQETADTVDDSAMGDTARSHLVGLVAWTATVTCHWDETDASGQESFTIGASVTFGGYPEGDTTGDQYASGTATVTNVTVGASLDGLVSRTFELQGNGALTWAAVA